MAGRPHAVGPSHYARREACMGGCAFEGESNMLQLLLFLSCHVHLSSDGNCGQVHGQVMQYSPRPAEACLPEESLHAVQQLLAPGSCLLDDVRCVQSARSGEILVLAPQCDHSFLQATELWQKSQW